ncbi:unnamed protein product [Rotaria sp. Silwood2]|nr:unnamed protein product [Rotaria sp. Silwood2]CAF2950766.1 unnamed protein product [Rotaria sp. Silwood2]CAF4114102.1 unnamed protein product [Rotaria sp. Silwood2]CAF4148607.1 unnamed protein product [Rotaria sp. Silwood2]
MKRLSKKGRRNQKNRRQQPTPPPPPQEQQQQQQQVYQQRIVVPVRGVSLSFCITSASPMVVQIVSPVPVNISPVPCGVGGQLQHADSVGGGVGGAGRVVVKHDTEECHDYSQFLIDNIK